MRVGREQLVQRGRAGARQTHDDERLFQIRAQAFGMLRETVDTLEPTAQCADEARAGSDAAFLAEPRFAVEAVEQETEILTIGGVAEVAETRRLLGLRMELIERPGKALRLRRDSVHAVEPFRVNP